MNYKLIDSERFHHMNATVETVKFSDGMMVKRLVSYASVVVDVCLDTGTIFIYPRHQYSPTTIRQVTRFLDENVPIDGRWSIGSIRESKRQADSDGYTNIDHYGVFYLGHVLGTDHRW